MQSERGEKEGGGAAIFTVFYLKIRKAGENSLKSSEGHPGILRPFLHARHGERRRDPGLVPHLKRRALVSAS